MTYTYDGTKRVVIQNGLVTHSDTSLCVVGKKPDLKALKACGWRKVKTPTTYYAGGSKNSHNFDN